MIPISVEFGIRAAVRLLRKSGRNFKSRQVEQARRLLEKILELECPDEKTHEPADPHAPQKTDASKTNFRHN